MAHLVENMAYVGQTPWHGLGNRLLPDQSIDEWIVQAGMDWEIKSSPVKYLASMTAGFGEMQAFTDKNVLYRSDNRNPLAVVSNRFHVVQPKEILEFYRDLSEVSGFSLETAGVLKSGKKLWALASTGQSVTLKDKDVTKGYLLLATACDGSMATTAQFTSVRVVCNNTLAIATNRAQGAIKVPHNTKFDATAVKRELGITAASWDEFMYQITHLSDRKVTNKEAKKYIEKVFTTTGDNSLTPIVQERSMSKVLALFDGQGKGATLLSAKNTAFGLLNAVTEFIDHEKRAKSVDHRLDSAWFGPGASIKQKAFSQALQLVA